MKYLNDALRQQQESRSLMSQTERQWTSQESWTPDTSFHEKVEIWWHDAETCGGPGWVDKEDAINYIDGELPTIKSIGYLCAVTDTHYAITDNVGYNQVGGITKIPKGMVIEMHNLERTRKEF